MNLLKLASFIALLATLLPSVLCFFGYIDLPAVKVATAIGSAAWFATAPMWMGRKINPLDEQPTL